MTFPDVAALIPHRPPMRLVDEVIAAEGQRIECRSSIPADSLFADAHGHVDSLVCVEYVAQTISAYVGLQHIREQRAPNIGFLVSCNEANFYVHDLRIGDVLDIRAEHVWGETGLGKFKGEVRRDGTLVAALDLSVVGDASRGGGS